MLIEATKIEKKSFAEVDGYGKIKQKKLLMHRQTVV